MKVLFVSNLFPNLHEPVRGVFNLRQMRHLARRCEVRVVAPIAWFPITGRFTPRQPVPATETIADLEVYHPKTFYLPKVGRTCNPLLYALSTKPLIGRIHREWPFDVILVNWAYPDACGVARIARSMLVPFVVSISGSDVNAYLQFRIRRRQILHMLGKAHCITVRSQALKKLLVDHGVPAGKIHVLYNGVDRAQFLPLARDEARRRQQIPVHENVLVYVGRLSPEKGVVDLLDAIAALRNEHHLNVRLVTVGDGSERAALQARAGQLGLDGAITWAGWKSPEEVTEYLSAADFLCLPSHREGMPNAALEAFACGKPVVATNVGGIPEVVTDETGVLARARDPHSFALALREALRRAWNPAVIRAHAARFDWDENARRLHALLESAARR